MYWDGFVRVYGGNFVTSSTSAVDVPGLIWAASANSLYEVDVFLAGRSSSSAGSKADINFSAAGATGTWIEFEDLSTLATFINVNVIGTMSAGGIWTATTADQGLIINAMVKTGVNAGNITVQALKITSGTLTIYSGSVMKVKKVN